MYYGNKTAGGVYGVYIMLAPPFIIHKKQVGSYCKVIFKVIFIVCNDIVIKNLNLNLSNLLRALYAQSTQKTPALPVSPRLLARN